MSFPDYSSHRPGLSVAQFLENPATATTATLPACLVGPACLLSRYGKEDPVQTLFTGSEQVLPWKVDVDGIATSLNLSRYTVDQDAVKLYGVGLEASLATFTAAGAPSCTIFSLAAPNVLKLSAGSLAGTSLATSLRGRDVQVGDLAYCRGVDGGTVYRRSVTALRGVVAAGTFGSNAAGTNSLVGNSSTNPVASTSSATEVTAPTDWAISCANHTVFDGLARGARYLTQYGERFTVTVHTAGGVGVGTVNISSASGKFSATNVTTVDDSGAFSITNTNAGGELGGVTLKLTPPADPDDELEAGMVFIIDVIGDYELLGATQVIGAGTYTGTVDTTYFVEVTGAQSGADFDDATVRITDSAGVDLVTTNHTVVDGTAFPLGALGLTFEFDGAIMPSQGGLRVGDVYYIHAKAGAVSTTSFDKVVLSGPAVDTSTFTNPATELFSVEFRAPFTGEIASDAMSDNLAWSADAEALTVVGSLAGFIEERDASYEWCAYAANVGYVVPSYRAFIIPASGEGLLTITDSTQLVTALGAADLDNPLAYAALQALIGAEGNSVLCLNTGGITTADFTAALGRARNVRRPYGITLLTSGLDDEADIWEVALAHVLSASSAERRYMRMLRCAVNTPGRYVVLSTQPDTTNYTATVAPQGDENLIVTIVAGASTASLTTRGLVAGDLVLLNSVYYPVDSVLSDTELLLSSGPDTAITPAVAVQIWKEDTLTSQKAYLIAKAASLRSRRASLVWCDSPQATIDGVLQTIPVQYGAAYLSGRRSFLPPQVGLTRQTVPTFESAPLMYTRWQQEDLDELAAAGIQIVTQEDDTGAVRVRHQVTTDTENGLLAFQENSTTRLDSITLSLDTLLDALIGTSNTNQLTVEEIRDRVIELLDGMKRKNLGSTYGPLIDDFTGLTVELDPLLRNRINCRVLVGIGPPLDRIYFELVGVAALPTV